MLRALIPKESRLAGVGWTGTGHFNRCPNGHVYVIGDCGGATETARCPECGATIAAAATGWRRETRQLLTCVDVLLCYRSFNDAALPELLHA